MRHRRRPGPAGRVFLGAVPGPDGAGITAEVPPGTSLGAIVIPQVEIPDESTRRVWEHTAARWDDSARVHRQGWRWVVPGVGAALGLLVVLSTLTGAWPATVVQVAGIVFVLRLRGRSITGEAEARHHAATIRSYLDAGLLPPPMPPWPPHIVGAGR